MLRSSLIALSSFILITALAEAREMRGYGPEEVEAMASLICNGKVVSIEAVAKKDYFYPEWGKHTEYEKDAQIRVLHVFKGSAPEIIQFTYRANDPKKRLADGGEHVFLQKGERCRFFLKEKPGGEGFVGVLDGEFDDNFAVELMSPAEKDDTPYLRQTDAVRIGRDFLAKEYPAGSVVGNGRVNCAPESQGGAVWFVSFDLMKTVPVHADGSVDRELFSMQQ